MKHLQSIFSASFFVFFLISCESLNGDLENKIDEITKKTESIDSLINDKVEDYSNLDSIVEKGNNKVKKLDSLINGSSSKIDSISKKGTSVIEKIIK
jgi:septation ring formation regulator EzrA